MDTYKLLILSLMLAGALLLGVALGAAGLSIYWLYLEIGAVWPAMTFV
ncbi:MAG: hypothetical protein V2L15_05395 [Desulfobacteraceae bacterium]|jgi:hypothetical protein|nr:hypothetical protein [Desulfobacteraceae bacterium]